MQRYYSSNPYATGLGNLISGAVQQRHQVHAQEAAAKDRANMQIYGGAGQGLGNLFNTFATRSGQIQDDATNFAQQVSLLNQRGQQALAFENMRSANDESQMLDRAWMAAQGMGGTSQGNGFSSFGMSPPQDTGVGTMLDGSVMQPEQATPPMQPTAPLPAIDPMFAPAYNKSLQKVAELNLEYQNAETSGKPIAEINAIKRSVLPQITQERQMLQQYQRPSPPTTFQEVAASGGAISIPGTYNYLMPDPKNGGYSVSTAVHPKSTESSPPIQIQRPDGSMETINVPPGGVMFMPDGSVIKRNAKGDPDVEWKPSAKATLEDDSKEYDEARDSLEKEREAIIKNIPPESKTIPKPPPISGQDVLKRMQEKEDALKLRQVAPKFQAINKRANELINGLMAGDIAKPDVDQWIANVIQTFGDDTKRWPQGLENTYRHVLENARDVYRNQLTVVNE